MQKQIQLQPHEHQTIEAAISRKNQLYAELGQMSLRHAAIEKTELPAANEAEKAIVMGVLTRNQITTSRNLRYDNGVITLEVPDEDTQKALAPVKANGGLKGGLTPEIVNPAAAK